MMKTMTSQGHVIGLFLLMIILVLTKSSLGDDSVNIACPSPPPLEHGSFKQETNMSATYTCDTGYRLSGSSSIQCEKNTWQSLSATCIIIPQPFGHRCYAENNTNACSTTDAVCVGPSEGQPLCSCQPFFAYNSTRNECYLTAPENVQCTIVRNDYHIVYSSTADCSNITRYEQFIVSVQDAESGYMFREDLIGCDDHRSFGLFSRMRPGHPFVITVDGGFGGHFSDVKRICASGNTRPIPPRELHFPSTEADGFKATWKYDYRTLSYLDGYRLNIQPGDLNINLETDIKSYVLAGLDANTRYNVSLFAVVGETESIPTFRRVCTRPLPPTNVTLLRQMDVNITLDIYPNVDGVAGLSTGVSTWKDPSICDSPCTVKNLTPGRAYGIKPYIFSECGGWSRPGSTIETFTRPATPRYLSIINNVTDSSLCVQWFASRYDRYEVSLLASDTLVITEQTDNTIHCFEDLSSGTLYDIHVNTIWRGMTSVTPDIVKVYTIPGPPINLKGLDNATETTLCVQWEPPAVGSADEYKLQLWATALEVLVETTDTMHCFGQLETDTKYTISVWTIWRGVTSVDPLSIEVDTQKNKDIEATLEYCRNAAMMHKELMAKMDLVLQSMAQLTSP